MEKLNLFVEQVNYDAKNGTFSANVGGEDPVKALSNVVDPNTDFKAEESITSSSASPARSFDLPTTPAETPKRHSSSTAQYRTNTVHDPLVLQLMSVNQGYNIGMWSSDMAQLPMVHAYVPVATYNKATVADGTVCDPQREVKRLVGSRESVGSLSRATGSHYYKSEEVGSRHNLDAVSHKDVLAGRVNGSMTTADQVAWEFRAARDALETASNMSGCSSRFEVESNCSDRAETMSTISTVSGYEEEMFRIKRLLLMDTEATSPQKDRKTQKEFASNDERSSYRKNIVNGGSCDSVSNAERSRVEIPRLKIQLQEALLAKEKYREALESSTRASLEWQDKCQESLCQRAHVEGRLESLKTELEFLQQKLASNDSENKSRRAIEGKVVFQEMEKMTCEHARIQQFSREVQNKNQELTLQLEFKATALTHTRNELQESESENEKLRIQLHELQVELDSKDGAIQGLKTKIASLHVESQAHLQANLKANNSIVRMKGEIDSLHKSNRWYCDQLHACQEAKVKVQQELMTCQSNLMSQSHIVEKMKSENVDLQRACEETRNRAVKEKESLMRKLEVIQADILEREAMILSQIQHGEASDTLATIAVKLKMIEEDKREHASNSEFTVKDLEQEIRLLKNELDSKNNKLETLETNNAELMVRVTTIQKTLNERELYLQNLQNNYRTLESALSKERDSLKDKDNLFHELLAEKIHLEVALTTETKEKKEVDEAIEKLRTDFSNVSRNYQAMKADLRLKENHISNLEKLLKELQADRQNLAAKNEALPIVEKKAAELAEQQKTLEETVVKLMETLAVREEQLTTQAKTIELHKIDLQRKEAVVTELESEKQQLEENLRKEKVVSQGMSDQLFQFGSPLEVMKELELARRLKEEHGEIRKKMKKEMKHSSSQTENEFKKLESSSYSHQVCPEDSARDSSLNESSSKQKSFGNGVQSSDSFEQLCSLVVETKNMLRNSVGKCTKENYVSSNKLENVESLCSVIASINNDLKMVLAADGSDLSRGNIRVELYDVQANDSTTTHGLVPEMSVLRSYSPQMRTTTTISTCTQTEDEVGTHAYRREVERLKAMMRLSETEHKEKRRRYELNVRTLLKEVKEHMRGRRAAEKRVKELLARPQGTEELQARVKTLEDELDSSRARCEEQAQALEKLQVGLLEAEKERGRLEEAASKRPVSSAPDEGTAMAEQLELRARELQLQHTQEKVSELEEELRKSKIIVKELRKEIFGEKCENSQLRKQVSSLRLGLETANEELDNKKVELGRSEAMCEVLRKGSERVQRELEREQRSHEDVREELEKLHNTLQDSRAKDPVLADQIKTLGYHLHQKTQEVTALQHSVELVETRWKVKEQSLLREAASLRGEITTLQSELDSLRSDRFSLQTQAAELRAALQCSLDSSKLLKAKLESFGVDEDKDALPDLTLSLPAPPARYDEARIAELLAQSSVLPHNKPLSNLRSCLDSLKLEMATLQEQITAKTSPDKARQKVQQV